MDNLQAAIEKAALEIGGESDCFIFEDCAAQLLSDKEKQIIRFFLAFTAKKELTHRIVHQRLKKAGIPPVGTVYSVLCGKIVVLVYEKLLSDCFGYCNRIEAFEGALSHGAATIKHLADSAPIQQLQRRE